MMIKSISKLSNRVLAVLLAVLILAVSLPITTFMVMANADKSILTTDINEKLFVVGESTEFTFTTTAKGDSEKKVVGSFVFSDPSAIEKLEYLEVGSGNWYEFDGNFGPADGFPMTDATSTFRATFNKAGIYTVRAAMNLADGSEELSFVEADVTVLNCSVLSSDISEEPFYVGASKEFKLTTTSNGHTGRKVTGTLSFSDPSAIKDLEYKNPEDDTWYAFDGNLGSKDGYDLINSETTFRVTFTKAGKYTVNAALNTADDAIVLTTLAADVTVYGTSALTTNISDLSFVVDREKEFTFTTVANSDADKKVVGTFVFSDPSAIAKLEYLEVESGNWYEFDGNFGPADGFKMTDATSTFRATFNKAGNYTVTAFMKEVESGIQLCTVTADVIVKDMSTVTTNIAEKNIVLDQSVLFSVTTEANGDADTQVLGTFDFSDKTAIAKLEYKDSESGNWYEFNGDFGPADGFSLKNATTYFRATFNKVGEYDLKIAMVTVEGKKVVCSTDVKIVVNDNKTVIKDIADDEEVETIFSIADKNKDGKPDEFYFTEGKLYEVKDLIEVSGYQTRNDEDKTYYSLTGEEGSYLLAKDFKLVDDSVYDSTPAGIYKIYIMIRRELNVGPRYVYGGPVSVEIKKADIDRNDIDIKEPYAGVYDGQYHNIVESVGGKDPDFSFTYSKDGENNFVAEMPQVKDVADSGKYIIRVTKNSNYNAIDILVNVKVKKAKLKMFFGTVENVVFNENNRFKYQIEKIVGINGDGEEFDVTSEISTDNIIYSSKSPNVIEVLADGTVLYNAPGNVVIKAEIVNNDLPNFVAKGKDFTTETTYSLDILFSNIEWEMTEPVEEIDGVKWYNGDVVIASEYPGWLVRQGESGEWTETIVKSEDGAYNNVKVQFKNSRNEKTDFIEIPAFVIDKSAPVITDEKVIFEQVNESAFAEFMNTVSFGVFFNKKLKITVNAADLLPDGAPASGIKGYTFIFKDTEGEKVAEYASEDGVITVDKEELENFKGTLAIEIEDKLENKDTYEVTVDNSNLKGYNEFTIENDSPIINIGKVGTNNGIFDFIFNVTDETLENFSGLAGVQVTVKDKVSEEEVVVFTEEYAADEKVDTKDYSIPVDAKQKTINGEKFEDLSYGILTFTVYAFDRAGNEPAVVESEVAIDTKAPEIKKITFSQENEEWLKNIVNKLSFGAFFNEKLEITVEAVDEADANSAASGLKNCTLTFIDGDKVVATFEKEFAEESNSVTFDIIDSEELKNFKGTVSVVVTDYADNKVAEENVTVDDTEFQEFVIENDAPIITVDTDSTINYKGPFTYEFSVNDLTEKNYAGIAAVKVTANGEEVFVKTYSSEEKLTDERFSFTVDPENKLINDVEVEDWNNGNVIFKAYAFDRAGNEADVKVNTINVDNLAPKSAEVTFEQKNAEWIKEAVNKLSFGLFYNEKLEITVEAEDDTDFYNAASTLKNCTLEFIEDGEVVETYSKEFDGNNTLKFEIVDSESLKNFQGQLKVTITDNAKNAEGEDYSNVLEEIVTIKDTEFKDFIIENDVPVIDVTTGANGEIYRGTFNYEFNVTDETENAYSGIAGVQVYVNEALKEEYTYDKKITSENYSVSVNSAEYITEDGVLTFKVVAYDLAGNISDEDIRQIKIDNRVPEVESVTFTQDNDKSWLESVLNKLSFGAFFKENVKITVVAKDLGDDYNVVSGLKDCTLTFVSGDKEIATFTKSFGEENFLEFTIENSAELKNFKGELRVTLTDNAIDAEGKPNVSEEDVTIKGTGFEEFIIENDKSDITIVNPADAIYKNSFDFEFSVNDKDIKDKSGIASVGVKVNDQIVYSNQLGQADGLKNNKYSFNVEASIVNGETVVNLNNGKETFRIDTFNGTKYTSLNFEIIAYDNSGNMSLANRTLYFDNTAPQITEFTFGGAADKDLANGTVEIVPYGFFFKDQVTVGITAEDIAHATESKVSGVKKLTTYLYDVVTEEYFTVVKSGDIYVLEQIESVEDANTIVFANAAVKQTISFEVYANFKGQMYAYATDDLGNDPKNCLHCVADDDSIFTKPDGSVVENLEKHLETSDITIIAPEKVGTQNNKYAYALEEGVLDANKDYDDDQLVPLYNDAEGVVFNVNVKDDYSGIASVKWTVFEGEEPEATLTKTISVADKSDLLDDENWEVTDYNETDKLVYAISGAITVTGNHNDMVLLVELTDRAGNVTYDYYVFGIDTSAPVINVKYDDDKAVNDTEYTSYFRTDRTATITITERNFNAENVVLKITNTDNVIPNVDLKNSKVWKVDVNEEDLDQTTYTAVIHYTADGDYTFDISVTDNAKNKNDGVDYGKSIAPTKFTIDKTVPTVFVSYDNNNAQNGVYYKAQRVATLTIVEHNFDAKRVNIIGTATDNGAPVIFPVASGWTTAGNVHTATIVYSADARYSFDIEFKDMAGNSIADYAAEEFYVDKTNPKVVITGIVDKSANNIKGNIGFKVEATDTNFNGCKVLVNAVVLNEGKLENKTITAGRTETISNGQRYIVTNLDTDGVYSVVCTVIDKAGNAFKEVVLEDSNKKLYTEKRSGNDKLITFSVNRNGSTFSLDEFTSNLVNTYYVKEVNGNPTIVEINPDPILESKITVNGKELVENTDYTVKLENPEGSWYKYSYVINKTVFDNEGEYSIVVSSKDKAKNEAYSDIKNVTVKFVVDKTAPTVAVAGIKKNGRYKVDKQTVTIVPADDGGLLKSVIVRLIDENGKLKEEILSMSGEELEQALANGGVTFELGQGSYQNVQIICEDYAGNIFGYADHEIYSNVTITTNAFMYIWASTAIRWCIIIGGALIVAGIIALIILIKRKKDNED